VIVCLQSLYQSPHLDILNYCSWYVSGFVSHSEKVVLYYWLIYKLTTKTKWLTMIIARYIKRTRRKDCSIDLTYPHSVRFDLSWIKCDIWRLTKPVLLCRYCYWHSSRSITNIISMADAKKCENKLKVIFEFVTSPDTPVVIGGYFHSYLIFILACSLNKFHQLFFVPPSNANSR